MILIIISTRGSDKLIVDSIHPYGMGQCTHDKSLNYQSVAMAFVMSYVTTSH